jgi:alginate production protein
MVMQACAPEKRGRLSICFILVLFWMGTSHLLPFSEGVFVQEALSAEGKPGNPPSIGFDFDDPPDTHIRLTPHLTFGAEIEIESEMVINPDLDRRTADNRRVIEPELEIALSYDPTEFFQAFLDMELTYELEDDQAGERTRLTTLEVSRLYVLFREILPGTSLQIGRQEFKDEREWLFDADLDGIRVFYRLSRFGLELSAAREELLGKDLLRHDESEPVNHYFLIGRYAIASEAEAMLYALFRDDRTPAQDQPLFLGFRSLGEIGEDIEYWADIAHVRGKEGERKIRGFGFDVGATREFDLPLKPYFTLGYAFGTGDDDPGDSIDKNFRQTGFQDNTTKFGGVVKILYYGEVLDPELSNLAVFTCGIGIRPAKTLSFDLIYHSYRQHRRSDEIRDSQLERDPTGESKDIGREIDLVIGYKTKKPNIGVEFAVGRFFPGSAFPDGSDGAWGFRFEMGYAF